MPRRVVDILRGPIAGRINYSFPDVAAHDVFWPLTGVHRVTPAAFHDVARAIESGIIHVEHARDIGAGFDAQYNSSGRTRRDGTVVRAKTIEIGGTSGRVQMGAILHECVHAYFDLVHYRMSILTNEAAAYVTSALAYRMTGVPWPRINDPDRAGENVADRLMHQYATGVGVPMVSREPWVGLLQAIQASPDYASELSGH